LPAAEYRNLCANARSRVQHLEWRTVVQQTAQAYQDLINRKRSSPETASSRRPSWTPILLAGSRIAWTSRGLLHPSVQNKA
jgi:hypothetical protein